MSKQSNERRTQLATVISDFLSERLNAKLEKLDPDDPKQTELTAQFVPVTWIEDAAHRVGQIQAVTHSLKPLHPDAKGSSFFAQPSSLPSLLEVGSHGLGHLFEMDVVGNAAALDVYKFLKLNQGGQSFLDLCIADDADLLFVFNSDATLARAWMRAFAGLTVPSGQLSSHTQAKQIYWLVGDDPHDDDSYHLLAPLYPTSLVHNVYLTLQDHRFSDASKKARESRKTSAMCSRPVHEYSNLAIQKLGGTKPQNISQLNSERRGDNYLLASLPPVWKTEPIKPVHGFDSLFSRFAWRKEVRQLVQSLRRFLASDPSSNRATREFRNQIVESILDELIQFAAELHTLEAGWSKAIACDLPPSHRQWLDPLGGVELADEEALEQVARDFANWLNAQLRDPLPMGDPEYFYWRKLAREALGQVAREVA